jgi:flagellar biosynthetic protein FliO
MGLEFLWMMVQTFVALALVCGLAYLIFRLVLPRVNFNFSSNSMIRVVDRIAIDARKNLCVIEVAGKWMLIAVTENGVQLVSELEKDAAEAAATEIKRLRDEQTANALGANFAEKLNRLMSRKPGGK